MLKSTLVYAHESWLLKCLPLYLDHIELNRPLCPRENVWSKAILELADPMSTSLLPHQVCRNVCWLKTG